MAAPVLPNQQAQIKQEAMTNLHQAFTNLNGNAGGWITNTALFAEYATLTGSQLTKSEITRLFGCGRNRATTTIIEENFPEWIIDNHQGNGWNFRIRLANGGGGVAVANAAANAALVNANNNNVQPPMPPPQQPIPAMPIVQQPPVVHQAQPLQQPVQPAAMVAGANNNNNNDAADANAALGHQMAGLNLNNGNNHAAVAGQFVEVHAFVQAIRQFDNIRLVELLREESTILRFLRNRLQLIEIQGGGVVGVFGAAGPAPPQNVVDAAEAADQVQQDGAVVAGLPPPPNAAHVEENDDEDNSDADFDSDNDAD